MVKKVLIVLALVFITIMSLFIYGVYRFLNPFGELVNEELSDSYFYTRNNEQIIYSPMGNWFSLGKHEMDIDLATFQVLGRDYAKDHEHAYFKSKVINFNIDVPSFDVKAAYVPVDKNHVYILIDDLYYLDDSREGFKILEDADPTTYEQLNYDFAKDKNFVFRNNEKITEVDHGSFEIINNKFCKDSNGVYHYWYQQPLRKITGINISEVIGLNSSSIRDDKHIYIHVDRRNYENVDEIINIPFKNIEQIKFFEDNASIRVDDKIYYEGLVLKEADAFSFEEIGYGYSKDTKNVFFHGKIIKGADPKTFKYDDLNYTFSDKNNTYEAGEIVKK